MKKTIIFTAIIAIASIALAVSVNAQSYAFDNNLSLGSSGQDVVNLQTWLISNGYDIPSVSSGAVAKGYFGSQTQAAVIAYQKTAGLPAFGFFGPMTRAYWSSHNGNSNQGSSLHVTSPNGGEVWQEGTTQNITWTGAQGVLNQTGDIKLESAVPACALPTANPRCMISVSAPVTIASGVNLSLGSYAWNVGAIQAIGCPALAQMHSNPDGTVYCAGVATTGQYKIQICPTNLTSYSQCDDSDNYFNITSTASNGQTPIISGIDAPTSLAVGQTGTWTVHATDPLNSTLSYSVDWGDTYNGSNACTAGNACAANASSNNVSQNTTFTHSYSTAGTYTITFTVKNSSGLQAQTTTTVVVESSSTLGLIQVTSPNGGEMWTRGTNQQITWASPSYLVPAGTTVDIDLVPYQAPCTTQYCSNLAHVPYTILIHEPLSQGSYTWNVGDIPPVPEGPTLTVPDGQYTIQICQSGTSNCDSSDSTFTITSSSTSNLPDINIISPNGGEIWTRGANQLITWTAPYSYSSSQYATTYATINLVPYQAPCTTQYCSNLAIAPYTIATTVPINQGSFSWTVGNVLQNPQVIGPASYSSVPDGQYTIQICQSGTSNCDSSDSTFTITSSSTSNLPDINIISPNGGETWQAGTNQAVNVNITGYSSQPSASVFVYTYLVDSSNHQTQISTVASEILSPGNQTYQVAIPANITPGSYKIFVDMYEPMTGGPNRLLAYDYSDNYFTVASSTSNSNNALPDLSKCPIGYVCTPTAH